MKIIVSPAKKMRIDIDSIESKGVPVYLDDTWKILKWLRTKDYKELKELWKCNDEIAEQNIDRLKQMDLDTALTPAILSYEGIAYQYMSPSVFEDSQIEYVQEHLRILSGFYGILKPLDAVTPYRLEMQAKADVNGSKNLYNFWKDKLYHEVIDKDRVIINLASKEYSKCIESYLEPEDLYITCHFGELIDGKFKQKGTYAKMARGEMIRYMAEKSIKDYRDIKKFDRLNYSYHSILSSDKDFYFIRNTE